jgi:ribonuclease J
VVYNRNDILHVSGHGCAEELKIIHALTKPKFFIPLHGEQRHLKHHTDLALQMGMERSNIVVAENGDVIELTPKTIKTTAPVTAGEVFVDGSGVGDVGVVVLRDRKKIAEDGIVVVIINISAQDQALLSPPQIVTRGFIYIKESETMMEELSSLVSSTLEALPQHKGRADFGEMRNAVRATVSNYLYKSTKRSPMIVPVITQL